jgi:hypothetical protein
MIKVKVTAMELSVSPMARLALSRLQAHDRAHNLEEIGGGIYETKSHVHFKKGEVLEVETVSKADMGRVEIVGEVEIDAPPVAQAIVETPRRPGRPRKI